MITYTDSEIFIKILNDRHYGPMLWREPAYRGGVRVTRADAARRDALRIQRIINSARQELVMLDSQSYEP